MELNNTDFHVCVKLTLCIMQAKGTIFTNKLSATYEISYCWCVMHGNTVYQIHLAALPMFYYCSSPIYHWRWTLRSLFDCVTRRCISELNKAQTHPLYRKSDVEFYSPNYIHVQANSRSLLRRDINNKMWHHHMNLNVQNRRGGGGG